MNGEQLPLFPQQSGQEAYTASLARTAPVTSSSPLSAAMTAFHEHMVHKGFAENTIKAFLGDLRILSRYLGPNTRIRAIGTRELNDFLTYLLYYRGKPCNRKSYSRRLVTLKVFFAWLTETGVLPRDPAAPIPHQRATTPLPQILYENQITRLLETTEALMHGDPPDARPHLLVSLLLQTGIKKGECMGIRLNDIDLSQPGAPALYIRYVNPRMHHKERKLALSPSILPALRQYLAQYEPKEHLFECTARNLEYVLHDVAQLAGLPDGLSFETLRWTSAVRDYQAGMPPEKLRKKMGLSEISWTETVEKLERLTGPAL
jgi:site-specific recombinase XerD